jgi:hypothetical protein
MRTRTLLLLLLSLASCGRTVFFVRVDPCVFDSDCPDGLRCVNQECRLLDERDGGRLRGTRRFGELCDGGAVCESSFCLNGPQGSFCTTECGGDGGCALGYACKRVPNPDRPDSGMDQALCALPQPLLCQDCTTDRECGATGGDRCVRLEGGRFCGRDCTFSGCPDLYRCELQPDGARQCVPDGRTCDCTPQTLGLQKGCRGPASPFGRCEGNQVCQADGGFTPCDAPAAIEETCNGVDDDCNGRVDDFTSPECTRTLAGRTCRGPQVCLASAGLVCTAQAPEAEACNGRDDDCDGVVDNGFTDAQGRYPQLAHCGRCTNDCAKIPNATSTRCDTDPQGRFRCRVLACAMGFFPSADGTFCQELPDTLCRACANDRDCVGPGARCLTLDGQQVCGRDCSAASPYGPTCPTGYACQPGSLQCVPTTNTCTCSARTLNSTRSCTVREPAGTQTCRGFETCRAPGPSWSVCDVDSFNPEICDGRDNNCDGRVDEGFRNQATNRYEALQHCGFCNNDCSKIWSPALQKTNGVCDTSQPLPRCVMGPCLTETVGGTTFEFVNVNGDTADGCECRRVQGNLTTDLPDRAPGVGVQPSWVDENCDGIDGVVTDAVFVSATGPLLGNGSRTAPFRTIAQGLASLASLNRRYVLVAQGLYRENVRLTEGQQLFGGYSSDFLKRDPLLHTTFIAGVQPTAQAIAAVHVENAGQATAETVIAGFTLVGWDAPPAMVDAPGEASIVVYLFNAGPRVVVSANDVLAGRGGQGGNGRTGDQGFGRQGSTALNGGRGVDSEHFPFGDCTPGAHRFGAPGGLNPQCPGGNAPRGGNSVCPSYSMTTNLGAQQEYAGPAAGSRNARGGFDRTFSLLSRASCSQVQESGYPSAIQGNDGQDGLQGPDGSGGPGGPGAPVRARFGSIVGARWVSAPVRASAGGVGVVGLPGGGGGAGAGVVKFTPGGCQAWEIGASGGGGGAGACGGQGGAPGAPGGASIAIFIGSNAVAGPRPTLTGNRIQRGLGGNGGNGGFGGAGGLGGVGGVGGQPDRWSSSTGGRGGEGGNGGPGGGGGGGAGGPSFGVLSLNLDVSGLPALNTFLVNAAIDTGGAGGVGGSSPGPVTSSGTGGARGAFGDLVTLRSCAAGCGPGTTCDPNGVCVPN